MLVVKLVRYCKELFGVFVLRGPVDAAEAVV
jgi:hypothetical protein